MTLIRSAAAACVVGALMALPSIAAAQGQTRDQDTYFTFSQPVELPNVTLPAGTYLFRLVDSASNRHIVRVTSEDRSKLYTTLMAIPSYSTSRPPDEPEVRFMETPAGGPNAIKIWFYPGNSVGHEFIYPRSQAAKLAKATGESVLTTKADTDVTARTNADEITRIDREGRDADANMATQREPANARAETGTTQPAPSAGTTPSGDTTTRPVGTSGREAVTSQQQQPAPPSTAAGTTTADRAPRTSLPRTGSVLPLLGLIGLGSIAGSRLVRRVRNR
jgi:hypothetical protein